jgi:hypothetical protein
MRAQRPSQPPLHLPSHVPSCGTHVRVCASGDSSCAYTRPFARDVMWRHARQDFDMERAIKHVGEVAAKSYKRLGMYLAGIWGIYPLVRWLVHRRCSRIGVSLRTRVRTRAEAKHLLTGVCVCVCVFVSVCRCVCVCACTSVLSGVDPEPDAHDPRGQRDDLLRHPRHPDQGGLRHVAPVHPPGRAVRGDGV